MGGIEKRDKTSLEARPSLVDRPAYARFGGYGALFYLICPALPAGLTPGVVKALLDNFKALFYTFRHF